MLVITGPNTGGKTVALKTAGLLPLMAQAGLLIPVADGSQMPVFHSVFADIGDEQSIAESLSTFSAHIANVVAMDRALEPPSLVLLDEAGGGTDPNEGGALATAIIDHFRKRGAMVVATTHFDALKTYASTTEGVTSAGFGFNPQTFAPTYRLHYGSPGSSLALEIATRLGLPAASSSRRARSGPRARRSSPSTSPRSSARCRGSITSAGWWRASARWSRKRRRGCRRASRSCAGARRRSSKRLDQKIEERLRDAQAGDRLGRRRAEGPDVDRSRPTRIAGRRAWCRPVTSDRRRAEARSAIERIARQAARRHGRSAAGAARGGFGGTARRLRRRSGRWSARWDSKGSSSRCTTAMRKWTCAASACARA